jgi:hypothetical protein
MFELLNDDLEEGIELLRRISIANGTERWMLMEENQIRRLSELNKTVELCNLLVYYYDRVKENG